MDLLFLSIRFVDVADNIFFQKIVIGLLGFFVIMPANMDNVLYHEISRKNSNFTKILKSNGEKIFTTKKSLNNVSWNTIILIIGLSFP